MPRPDGGGSLVGTHRRRETHEPAPRPSHPGTPRRGLVSRAPPPGRGGHVRHVHRGARAPGHGVRPHVGPARRPGGHAGARRRRAAVPRAPAHLAHGRVPPRVRRPGGGRGGDPHVRGDLRRAAGRARRPGRAGRGGGAHPPARPRPARVPLHRLRPPHPEHDPRVAGVDGPGGSQPLPGRRRPRRPLPGHDPHTCSVSTSTTSAASWWSGTPRRT